MNEVLYDLYEITGNSSYAELAALFDKACFLGPLALDPVGPALGGAGDVVREGLEPGHGAEGGQGGPGGSGEPR